MSRRIRINTPGGHVAVAPSVAASSARSVRLSPTTPKQQDARLAFGIDEVAEVWGVSRGLVERLVKSGELPSFKAGDRRLIARRSLDEFMGERSGSPSDGTDSKLDH